ncbi:MAG: hypothetical protein Q8N23_23100 [Archangium sp.]|nr:hypothetical protein [Archangium sp.]MDP3155578.1 hypothetical protein [Archangium sp.]MDP3570816.1 hypothetical protein [Archangium sp.]
MKAAEVTPGFPRSLQDLDAWHVFADQLIERGDKLGAYIAAELSLGPHSSREQSVAFQKRAQRVCSVPGTLSATWMLGHVRGLTLIGQEGRALTDLRSVLEVPTSQNLEQLSVGGRSYIQGRRWAAALRQLPPSCRRCEILTSYMNADVAQRLLELLPSQLDVLRLTPRHGMNPAPFISDRFEWVDLRGSVITPELASAISVALAATSRVRLLIGRVRHRSVLGELLGRSSLGTEEDAALVEEGGTGGMALLPRVPLEILQSQFGFVTARDQLLRGQVETWGLDRLLSNVTNTVRWAGDAVLSRVAGAWSIRATREGIEVPAMSVDGVAVGIEAVPLVEGSRLMLDGQPWRFVRQAGALLP